MTFLASLFSADFHPISLIVGAAIVVLGLFVIGFSDLLRFHFGRVWAISGVCFSESIRRRVLWITPLAILGVIVVSQLQRPFDEQDAIRQTTKFCLFATGLVVTLGTIILACTNLPREIENRVIFTVVTKPTTRLEIILGKIVGFARVSAAILFIMGLFTWVYLQGRAMSMESSIKARLDTPNAVDNIIRPTLQHYVSAGLLNAKTIVEPNAMNVYAKLPEPGSPRRIFTNDGAVLFPFVIPTGVDTSQEGAGLKIRVRIGYDADSIPKPSTQPLTTGGLTSFTGPSPLVASTQSATAIKAPTGPPAFTVQIFDPNQNTKYASELNKGKPITINDPQGVTVELPLAGPYINDLIKMPVIYVAVLGSNSETHYWIDNDSVQLIVAAADKPSELLSVPMANPLAKNGSADPIFLGRMGTEGQQIKGNQNGLGSLTLFSFDGLKIPANQKALQLELRFGLEHSGDENLENDIPSRVSLKIVDPATMKSTDIGIVVPENNRTVYTSIPAELINNTRFDLSVQCLTSEQWVSMNRSSVAIVASETPFAWNLFKSLFILWLLTLLVISISIFCSTFLSWPIAVVLTLVILLGHWGVQELGDAASAGLGRQFVQDFGVRDPAASQALSSTVEQLNKVLGILAGVLPDIGSFSATEDIERGVSVPLSKITEAAAMMLGFGLPLSVLAYVFLKNKEVAP